ncbi:hypothetical protein [Roseateles albus]|uniref:Uncharacterized protein n=1 Tax=Roseateles albus TaxID=2987525 RepID=A0ABT5K9S6_9BURK|nr:hypothetical protein [Roseateles albus]MDC8770530.1 hypothetical protein [Roseateles albus]
MVDLEFPFVPKSTRSLARGQFWSIPLSDGRFGAGCVIGTHLKEGKQSSRIFIAGVVRWVGIHPPKAANLQGQPVISFAFAHLKAITESGGSILGEAELQLEHAPPEAEALSMPTWGYGMPRMLAQREAENAG